MERQQRENDEKQIGVENRYGVELQTPPRQCQDLLPTQGADQGVVVAVKDDSAEQQDDVEQDDAPQEHARITM